MKFDKAGTYTLKYTAIDECGNETVIERTVTVNALVTKKTVLFNDGTLIINELSSDRASNITSHGAVVAEYEPLDENNPYNFTGTSQRPWNNKSKSIQSVKFGSTVKPVSIAYWLQACPNIYAVDFTNFDGSEVVNARAFLASTDIEVITLPSMAKLENIRYMFNRCAYLQYVTFGEGGNIKDTTDCFQACYNLELVDMAKLTGTIELCDRMFANVADDGINMQIRTIYSNDDLDFSQATSSGNVFRSCTSLVGGNGTTFDDSYVGKQYARIDKAGQPGYFTEKA